MNDTLGKLRQKEELLKQREAEIRNLEKQVYGLRKHNGIAISDHAIVRFLERTANLDIVQVQKKLINDQVLSYYRNLGDGTYPTGLGNIRVVIKNATIITVLT